MSSMIGNIGRYLKKYLSVEGILIGIVVFFVFLIRPVIFDTVPVNRRSIECRRMFGNWVISFFASLTFSRH